MRATPPLEVERGPTQRWVKQDAGAWVWVRLTVGNTAVYHLNSGTLRGLPAGHYTWTYDSAARWRNGRTFASAYGENAALTQRFTYSRGTNDVAYCTR